MSAAVETAYAKINLALHVRERMPDGYHRLETIFAFCENGDGLYGEPADDFGLQGEKPSHPELLDWLAVQFREGGWDVKAIERLIVTSSTYRQSSKVSPELVERIVCDGVRIPDGSQYARAAIVRGVDAASIRVQQF